MGRNILDPYPSLSYTQKRGTEKDRTEWQYLKERIRNINTENETILSDGEQKKMTEKRIVCSR